ncbi:helix-turn-helix transcriptional regulator [Dactylosporangium sp. NPDC048998]|uniref:helix-turn-helix transcriptional regulator n=1 Tax=Dactylosporangium sp. NPDC048998 TaxID=3363976 RepID=UPI00370FAE5C
MTLATLRSRTTPASLARPHRPAFHHLVNIDRGQLRQTVDFTGYTLVAGEWLWIRPRQVLQWGDLARTEGTLILFQEEFLDAATISATGADDPFAPARIDLEMAEQQVLHQAAQHLTAEFVTYGAMPPHKHLAALRHLLAALLLRLSQSVMPAEQPDGNTQIFRRFRDLLEQRYTITRTVEDYATRLGYSPRTLTRASVAVVGVGAKEVIGQRVILEAKRMLAHTSHSAAQVATRLGFDSATNFNKYFHQRTGQTPIDFRTSIRGAATSD